MSRLVETLGGCAEESKAKMNVGEEPTSLIDFWMQDTLGEIAVAEAAREPTPPHSGNHGVGRGRDVDLFGLNVLKKKGFASSQNR